MAPAEIIACSDAVIKQVTRIRSTYKTRNDGTERPFGGINVLMLGDFGQLQPCGGTAITSNPLSAQFELACHGLALFWDDTSNTVRTPV